METTISSYSFLFPDSAFFDEAVWDVTIEEGVGSINMSTAHLENEAVFFIPDAHQIWRRHTLTPGVAVVWAER